MSKPIQCKRCGFIFNPKPQVRATGQALCPNCGDMVIRVGAGLKPLVEKLF